MDDGVAFAFYNVVEVYWRLYCMVVWKIEGWWGDEFVDELHNLLYADPRATASGATCRSDINFIPHKNATEFIHLVFGHRCTFLEVVPPLGQGFE